MNLPSVGQKKVSILFVGNSLTYSNNLPVLVNLIANCDSVEMICKTVAFPNYALEDHWNEGKMVAEIKSGAYDFVVVQQGPSSQLEGRMMLINDGTRLAKLCKENKTQLAFYTVWPSKARSMDFPSVLESYKLAADSTKSILCPAGKAWLTVWETNPETELYSEDDFHPNYQGSLLAALVIYGSVMQVKNLSFVDYNTLRSGDLLNSDFKILVRAAQRTLSGQEK
jgi:hypothetical protein